MNRRDFGRVAVILDDVLGWVRERGVEATCHSDGDGLTGMRELPLLQPPARSSRTRWFIVIFPRRRGKGIDLRITEMGFRRVGGLWGITVDRLGCGDHPAVNGRLYGICRNVHGRSEAE